MLHFLLFRRDTRVSIVLVSDKTQHAMIFHEFYIHDTIDNILQILKR